ncbi:MAG TPA: hypothetical protein PKN47_22580 [Nitrospira sp.]|nr:hypothetical protein [Nitrospira sp.]
MNIELHDTQNKARVANEDRKAFYGSLLTLKKRLEPAWSFRIAISGGGKEILSQESLEKHFAIELVNAQLNFLKLQKKAGNHFATIEDFIANTPDINVQKVRRNYLRLMAWRRVKGQFLESLCLMSTLTRMIPQEKSFEVCLFAQEGPLPVQDQGVPCFIWTQQSVESQKTGLRAVPDITVTNTPEAVTTSNIVSIVECKCRSIIGAGDLRGEFGKAYDMGSPSYVLMSYNEVPQSVIDGGRALGIDVQVFSLHTSEREVFLRGERDMAEDMAIKLVQARRRRGFLTAIEQQASNVRRRVLS